MERGRSARLLRWLVGFLADGHRPVPFGDDLRHR